MKKKLESLFKGRALSRADAEHAMRLMIDAATPPEQIAALLGALRAKKETFPEIAGFVRVMREKSIKVTPKRADLIDNCGTGGDGLGTFNISTTTSFVLAAGGVGVAKHGNRSVSSRCGSADVAEALGVPTQLAPADAARSIDTLGFGFLFAPSYHPALARVGAVRKAIGVPTIFNILGPLANPAPIKRQLLGVYDGRLAVTMAEVLLELGMEDAMVVTGEGGIDEITLEGPTQVVRVKDGKIQTSYFAPSDAGLKRAETSALKGGENAAENAAIVEKIFAGEKGPKRDVVVLNAAAGFLVAGKATSLREGAELAVRVIDGGEARGLLEKLRKFK